MTAAGRRRIARVFVDTSAFFALADQDDNHYREAQAIQQRLITNRSAWFTSNFVVAETHALFLARLGVRQALEFLDRLERSSATLVRINAADEARARAILRQYAAKDFSFTDAASFAVIVRLGLDSTFSFDRHFEQYGFVMLAP